MSNSKVFSENILVLNCNGTKVTNSGVIINRHNDNIINGTPTYSGKFNNIGNNYLYLDENMKAENNFYKGMIILIKSGHAAGEYQTVTKYNSKDNAILVEHDFKKNVEKNDIYEIFDDSTVGILYNEDKNELVASSLTNRRKNINYGTVDFHSRNVTADSTVFAAKHSTTSDARLKKNVQNIEYDEAEKIINSINGVKFDWIDESLSKEKQIGFIAQDVNKTLPGIVNTDKNGFYSVEYDKIVPLLVEMIKGLNNRVKELENIIHNK